MTTLEAALEYAALGWPVLPTGGDDGKKPLLLHGVNDASADPERIRGWWKRWPDANIAIATGAPGPDVLDIDKPDAAGDAVDRLMDEWNAGVVKHVVSTQRGLHVYFVGSDERTIKLPYGELRRKGSYVMAPPSVRPDTGHHYVWGGGVPPSDQLAVPAPAWLTEGRMTAGTGVAEPVERVARGDMYDHLLDLAVRLARAGILDGAQRERILMGEFERVREPGASYGGSAEDTRRLANAPTDILERESAKRSRPDMLPPPPTGEGEGALAWRTLTDIWNTEAAEPDWIWDGNVATGFVTVVGGRPKVGKSTVVYAALDRLIRGEREFLGGTLHATDVVVVSEEHVVTARQKFSGPSDRVHLLTRDAAWPLPEWKLLLASALAEAQRTNAKLLLIDSFTFWAGLEAEMAQDAGAVQQAFAALTAVSREGVGVMLIHHQRKAGGDYGDALLGSTAFSANADHIIEIERVAEGPATYRTINRVGRWFAEPVLLVNWSHETGYELLATPESLDEVDDFVWMERLRAVLPEPGTSKKQTELAELLGTDQRAWGRAMASLQAAGEVLRTGVGGRNDPVTYTRIDPRDRPDI